MNSDDITVCTGTASGTLSDCLTGVERLLGPGALALGSSPDSLWFGRYVSGGFVHPDEAAASDTWYEARVFGPLADFRWVQQGLGPEGRAAIVAEGQLELPGDRWSTSFASARLVVPQTALLWGTGVGPHSDGWSTMAAARIGRYRVPLAGVQKDESVQLYSVEYFGPGPDGNAVSLDERLCGLQVQEKSK